MPTRTRVFKSLIHRLSGRPVSDPLDAETVFRAFGESVEKRVRMGTGKGRRPSRRRLGPEATR